MDNTISILAQKAQTPVWQCARGRNVDRRLALARSRFGLWPGNAQGYATLDEINFRGPRAARLCAVAKDEQILVAQRVAEAVEEITPLEEV